MRRLVIELHEAGGGIKTIGGRVIEAAKHDFAVVALLEKIENCMPFQTAPFVLLIVLGKNNDNEIGFIVIKGRQVHTETASPKLGFVELIVENLLLGEPSSKTVRELTHELSFGTREGKRYPKALGRAAHGPESCSCEVAPLVAWYDGRRLSRVFRAEIASGGLFSDFPS